MDYKSNLYTRSGTQLGPQDSIFQQLATPERWREMAEAQYQQAYPPPPNWKDYGEAVFLGLDMINPFSLHKATLSDGARLRFSGGQGEMALDPDLQKWRTEALAKALLNK